VGILYRQVANPMCLSVCTVTKRLIGIGWIPFGMVSARIGRGIGVLDGSGNRRKEGGVLVLNVGHPIVTNGILSVRRGDAALPKLLWDFLLRQQQRGEFRKSWSRAPTIVENINVSK